jgi:predicted NBD/HSP70 family sugar kinase
MNKSIKEQYAGLDVSLKSVSICVSDGTGELLWRGEVDNEPSEVARILARRAPNLVRAVIETGSCGAWLKLLSCFGFHVEY